MSSNPVETSTLLQLYDSGLSLQAVADHVGLTRQAVHLRLKESGYKPRPKGPRIRIDRKTLIDLYVEKGLTLGDVANHFNCNRTTVANHLEKNGIDRRRRGPFSIYRIYFDKLERAGDSVLIPWAQKPNPHPILHKAASSLGFKVSIKKADDGQMRVTRVV